MLQQWRLEAHRLIEGNRKWDIWLHDWELESMRHNVQAWFWRASLHVRAVPRKVQSRPQEGWFKVCVLLLWRRVKLRAFTLVRRSCRSPALAYESLSETAPEPSPGSALWLLLLWQHTEYQETIWGCGVFPWGILGWGRESQNDSYLTLHRISCITYCGILFPPTEFCSIAFRKRLLRKSFYS